MCCSIGSTPSSGADVEPRLSRPKVVAAAWSAAAKPRQRRTASRGELVAVAAVAFLFDVAPIAVVAPVFASAPVVVWPFWLRVVWRKTPFGPLSAAAAAGEADANVAAEVAQGDDRDDERLQRQHDDAEEEAPDDDAGREVSRPEERPHRLEGEEEELLLQPRS